MDDNRCLDYKEKNELKPCAHCGENVKLNFGMSLNPFISCKKCKLDMSADSKEKLISKWNRRRVWINGQCCELV